MTPLQMGLCAFSIFVAAYAAYTMLYSSEERANRASTIYNYAAYLPYILLIIAIIMFYK
jgi:hypothetical protein